VPLCVTFTRGGGDGTGQPDDHSPCMRRHWAACRPT